MVLRYYKTCSLQNSGLSTHLSKHLILHFVPVNWPPRSCDITALDLFLCLYVKSKVLVDKPATIQYLPAMITNEICEKPSSNAGKSY